MKSTHYLLLLICFSFASCSSSIEENDLDNWIRNNDFEKIMDNTYSKKKLNAKNQERYQKLIKLYSEAINEKKLKTKPFVDHSMFTKGTRQGYDYVDEEGNLHYNITYKLLSVDKDSTMKFNYIDFRSADRDIPCAKAPIFAGIRCIYTPKYNNKFTTRAYLDSLEMIGPIELAGHNYYHYDLLRHQKRNLPKDSIKNTIVLNIGNNWIRSNIDIITKDIDQLIDMDQYDLAYFEDISTPTLRIGFDSGSHPKYLTQIIDYFKEKLGDKLLVSILTEKEFVPLKGDVIIGHAYEERRKVKLW